MNKCEPEQMFFSGRRFFGGVNNMKYIVLIHEDRESGGYWGECPELPGCYSQGETIEELMVHMKEAAKLYLNESEPIKIEYVKEIRELAL